MKLEECWESYKRNITEHGATEIQVLMSKSDFYNGFSAALVCIDRGIKAGEKMGNILTRLNGEIVMEAMQERYKPKEGE